MKMSLDTILTNDDIWLYNRGENFRAYEKIGAHLTEINGQKGVHLALWAPNAKEVILRNFRKDGAIKAHDLQPLRDSGIWTRFVEGMQELDLYKYLVRGADNKWVEKIDPFGFFFEVRPNRAAIVYDLTKFRWSDKRWIENRAEFQGLEKPISVYSMHGGSWKRKPYRGDKGFLTYTELAKELIPYLQDLNFTHVEFRPLFEHALDISWGYQKTGFFAPTSRLGNPEQFQQMINTLHESGIAVIMDFATHFPKDDWGLRFFDGAPLYEPLDARRAEIMDWGTKRFDFGKPGVRSFLYSAIDMLLRIYHIDAVRFDGVAYMLFHDHGLTKGEVPLNPDGSNVNWDAVYYYRKQNQIIRKLYPGVITIAELADYWAGSTSDKGLNGLGFTFQQDLGFSKNVVDFFKKDPIDRKFFMNDKHLDIAKPNEPGEILIHTISYVFNEKHMIPLPHDLFVHGKSSLLHKMLLYARENQKDEKYLDEHKYANVRLLWLYQYGHPGKKLNHMGSEFGQRNEWDPTTQLEWELLKHPAHQNLKRFFKDLNLFYRATPALYQLDHDSRGFEWIDCMDSENTVLSWIRHAKDKVKDPSMIFVFNFTPVIRSRYRIGVNRPGRYKEVLNTDSGIYGGRGSVTPKLMISSKISCHNREHSIQLRIPGYTGLVISRI
jgi:1,4-alpha-glucan branching enzyme